MPIVWDEEYSAPTQPAASTGQRGIAWDDESEAKTGFWPRLRESLYNLSLGPVGLKKADIAREQLGGAARRAPGLEAIPTLAEAFFPLPTGLPAADAVRTAMAESERQNRAMLLGGTLAAPLDPTTYAFLPAAAIPNMAGRVAASAAIGASPELVRPKPNPVAALLQGALAGGLAAPSLRPAPRPAPRPALPENLPGVSPYSFLLPAERTTAGEAGQAAQEGYAAMREAMPQPRPRPAIAEAPALYPAERFKNIVWDEPRAKGGFVSLPDEGIERASAQAAGRAIAPPFYSHLERSLDERMPNAATPDQVRGILRGSGVNQEELDWLDLDSFLRDKPKVSKQEVLDYVKQNEVQVQEVVKGSPPTEGRWPKGFELYQASADELVDLVSGDEFAGLPEGQSAWAVRDPNGDIIPVAPINTPRAQARRMALDMMEGGGIIAAAKDVTKFHQYQLPGGTNYRELLLTVPDRAEVSQRARITELEQQLRSTAPGTPEHLRIGNELGRAEREWKRGGESTFRSPHFDEPNVLAHVRFNDRVDAQGKKVLFLEELQSDWHQKGRKEGYSSQPARVEEAAQTASPGAPSFGKQGFVIRERNGQVRNWYETRELAEEALSLDSKNRSGVPDAPFKKTWHELALKRMIRYAAENGYDKLAWTTGEQQAARYDLSKQIDQVLWKRWSPETGEPFHRYTVGAMKGGKSIFSEQHIKPNELGQYVGKELAQRIESDTSRNSGNYSGLDLKVGGEGMKGFYDQILPSYLNRYAKKWGGRVSDITLPGTGKMTLPGQYGISEPHRPGAITVHSLDLTPAMRQEVLTKGQRRFGGFVTLPEEEGAKRAGKQALASALASKYGTTQDPTEAMFVAKDGQLIKKPAHMKNEAYGFHEEVLQEAYPKQPTDSSGNEISRQEAFVRDTGVVHFNSDGNAVNFALPKRMTPAQAQAVMRMAKETPNAYIDGIDYYYDTANPMDLRKFNSAVDSRLSFAEQRGFVELPEEQQARAAGRQAIVRAAAGAVPPTPETAPSRISPEAQTRAQKIVQALREARPVRRQQEALYTQERGARAGAVKAVREKVPGEKGYYAELSQLKGELPKAQYESIRSRIAQSDIDELFNDVNRSSLDFWDTLPAKEGLVKMLEGRVPTHGELDVLKRVFGAELPQELLAKRPLLEKLKSIGLEIANLPRSLTASFDLSAPLRQGVFLIGRPKEWLTSLGSMFKQVFSEKNFQEAQAQIRARPSYPVMRDARLQLTDIGETLSLREEQFMAQLGERIPVLGKGVRASNRAYVGFLNRLRADVFDDLLKKGQQLGLEDDPEFLSSVGSFVNNATGRGNIGGLERAAPLLNAVFFSPRLMMSRLQLLNPGYYVGLQPAVRKEAIKSLLSFVGAGSVALGLAKMNGAEVGTDPRSADFGKMKFGNTRYDIWGGFQPLVRGVAQLITGEQISTTTGREIKLGEGYKPTTRLDIIQRWFGSKESPIASLVTELLQGQTMTGEDVQVAPAIVDRFIPMFAQDVYDVMREQGIGKAWTAIPSLFGVGVQTYGQQVPQITTTPSGRETVGFRQPPSLGEVAVNAVTGKKVSDVPESARPALDRARQQEAVRKAEIDKAKRLTLEDGKRRRVGQTEIYLDNGIVKTRTRGRVETPQRIYERDVRKLRR